MTGYILTALVAALMGYRIGYEAAHKTIATECERIGAFYVGEKVYECKAKENA